MNTITKFLALSAFALGAAFPLSSFAQADMNPGKMATMPASAAMTDGEVKKVDPDAGKITIKHGDIKHLDMPGMTMVFPVKDKSLLTQIKAGDKIKFMVISESGKMLVTDIQKAP